MGARGAWWWVVLAGCGAPAEDEAPAPDAAVVGDAAAPEDDAAPDAAAVGDAAAPEDDAAAPAPDAAPEDDAAAPPPDAAAPEDDCPDDVVCVRALPFSATGSTAAAARDAFDAYACAPETDESGPEVVYRIDVPAAGFLAAEVDVPEGVDVDLHLLDAPDPEACLDRGHWRAGAWVEPGRYWLVADSWVDSEGRVLAGEFSLSIALSTAPDLAAAADLDPLVAERGLRAFGAAWARGDTERFEYAITDFSLHSALPRQWILDLASGDVRWRLHVAHGRGSSPDGDTAWARTFSNVPESHQSSLGLMRGAEPYVGDYGVSFRLDGLEPGYNDRVRDRDIVMHPWEGSRPEYAQAHGETGPTWGCPAVDDRVAPEVVDALSGGALLWFWYPDGDWSERSEYLR